MRSLFKWRTTPAPRPSPVRLAVEALEDRRQPATTVAPDLLSQFDTGSSPFDNVTRAPLPAFMGATSSSAGIGIALVIDNAVAATLAVKHSGGSTFLMQPATPLADGDHIARYYDASTQAYSAALAFTIDSTPPAVPPAAVLLTNDDPTNVVLQIQGPAGARLHLWVAGQELLAVAGTGSPQSVSVDVTTLLPDLHAAFNVWVVAEDTAGNVSAPSDTLSAILHLEGPAPPSDLRLEAVSDTGDSNSDGITKLNTLAFSGTALPGRTIQLYVDGTAATSQVVGADGTFSLNAGPLSEGSHQAWVTAANANGTVGVASNPVAVTVDTTAPTLTDVALTPSAISPNGDGVQDSATFTFTLSEAAYIAIYFLDSADTYLGTIPLGNTAAGAQSFDLAVPEFTEGHYSIIVVASDAVDNLSDPAEVPFTVDLTPPDAPTFALAGQAPGSPTGGISNQMTPLFVGVAEAGAKVELHEGTAILGTATAAADGSWSIPANLAEGDHTLFAVARDAAGNSSSGASQSLTIDTTAPVVDAGADATGPAGTSLTLVAQATDAHPGSESWDLVSATTGQSVPSVSGPSLTFTPSHAGTYVFRHTATDAAGNVGQDTVTVIALNPPPAIHVSWPAAVNSGAPLVVQLAFTDADNDTPDSWTIHWGDGSTDTLPGTATRASHTYPALGSFTPSVTGTLGSLVLTSSGSAVAVQRNQAPTLTSTTASAPSVAEDTANSAGVAVAALVANLGVVDTPGNAAGLAITGADSAHGVWQFTLDGTTWTPLGNVTDAAARLLAADDLTRLRFVPAANWNGTATLTARAWDQSDGRAGGALSSVVAPGQSSYSSQAATISFTVTPVNDAPVLSLPTSLTAFRNTDMVIGSAFSVADVDATRLRITLVIDEGIIIVPSTAGLNFATGSGTPTLTLDGPVDVLNQRLAALIYRPTPGYLGSVSVAITVNDLGAVGSGGPQLAIGTLAIAVVNRPPHALANPVYSMTGNTTLYAPAPGLLVAFVDPDGDPLTLVQASPPSVGTVTVFADGSFHYTPPQGFVGTATFAVQAFDGVDFSAPLWVTIRVMNGNGLRR